MGVGGQRIGDQVTVKGLTVKAMFETSLGRATVFFRVMLLRGAKGETFGRDQIFKNASANKMIDMVNTERFSIVAPQYHATASHHPTSRSYNQLRRT